MMRKIIAVLLIIGYLTSNFCFADWRGVMNGGDPIDPGIPGYGYVRTITFDSENNAILIYAYTHTPEYGGQPKELYASRWNGTSWSVMNNGNPIDMGAQTTVVNFGLTIRNLGPKMKFIDEKYALPLSITAGGAYSLIGAFNLAMDLTYEPVDKKRTICFGTEFFPMQFFALRAGYLFQAIEALYNSDSNLPSSKIAGQHGLGGGIGIKVLGYNLDYAFVPYFELGTTQRVSFSAKF
ncbi:MAG: hypothetical protein ABIJ15_02905 [bacterium]